MARIVLISELDIPADPKLRDRSLDASKKAVGVDIDLHPHRARYPNAPEPVADRRLQIDAALGFDEKTPPVPSAQDRERRRRRT